MKNIPLKILISSVIVISLFGFSFFLFSSYQPKVLKEVREVKGYSTDERNVFDIPYPRYAKGLAFDKTYNTRKYTFSTDKSPQEIRRFYDNILLEDDWRIKKEGEIDNFVTVEYRKENFSLVLWASYDTDTKLTFSSVEIMDIE